MHILNPFFKWLFSEKAHGVGSLLLGVAAVCGVITSKDLLDEILKVQDQAKNIEHAVGMLGKQIIQIAANNSFEVKPELKSKTLTKQQAIKALETFPTKPRKNEPTIILENRESTIESLIQTPDINKRRIILEDSLQYVPAAYETNSHE